MRRPEADLLHIAGRGVGIEPELHGERHAATDRERRRYGGRKANRRSGPARPRRICDWRSPSRGPLRIFGGCPLPPIEKRGRARRSAVRAERAAPAAFSLPARALSYALAIFLGSTLLFLLEPIAAKRLVPLLGGSAAVWTACLVFFQSALLLGYYVAHLFGHTHESAHAGNGLRRAARTIRRAARARRRPYLVGQCRPTDRQRVVVALGPHRPAVRHAFRRVRSCKRGSRARRREDGPTRTGCSRSRTSVRSSRCWRTRG